ncbi:MAG: hypothetical protein AAF557_19015 [Pseudomonadota bacterium]
MRALIVLAFLSSTAIAADNIRILPDQAILACTARTMQELEQKGGGEAKPIERFVTEPMENFMYRVKGRFQADLDGSSREVKVECDVSSNGVDVFTMLVDPR